MAEVWLNIASSHYALPGFIHLDNDPRYRISGLYPFLWPLIPERHRPTVEAYRKAASTHRFQRYDCRKRLPFRDGSVDHILCSHFLEHLHLEETRQVLRDFHRVLRSGGTLDIIVPDIEVISERYTKLRAKEEPAAADAFMRDTGMTSESRPSWKFRLLEFLGGYGLKHLWLYDTASMTMHVEFAGFKIKDLNDTPSREFRKSHPRDGSIRIVAEKP